VQNNFLLLLAVQFHPQATSLRVLLTVWVSVEVCAHSTVLDCLTALRCLVECNVPRAFIIPKHVHWSSLQWIEVRRLLDSHCSFNQTFNDNTLTAFNNQNLSKFRAIILIAISTHKNQKRKLLITNLHTMILLTMSSTVFIICCLQSVILSWLADYGRLQYIQHSLTFWPLSLVTYHTSCDSIIIEYN